MDSIKSALWFLGLLLISACFLSKSVSAQGSPKTTAPATLPLTVTVLPQTQEKQVLVLADLLAAELAKTARFQVVDRTQTDRILAEWKWRKTTGRILAWDMLVRLSAVDHDGGSGVQVTCVDLSRGNIQARKVFGALEDEGLPAKMAAICRAAAIEKTQRKGRKSIRLLGMGESGMNHRLIPMLTRFDVLMRECIRQQPGWEIAQHVEALTAKEEALMLYTGMARLGGGRRFAPLADATLEATLREKDAEGKSFEKTPVIARLRFQRRGRAAADWVSIPGQAGNWPDLARRIKSSLRDRLAGAGPAKEATADDLLAPRKAAEKAYEAAMKAHRAPSLESIRATGYEDWRRAGHAEGETHAKTMAAVLKLDPTFEPAAYELVRALCWLDWDSPLQGRAALEAYRYIRRFPKGHVLEVLRLAGDSFGNARVHTHSRRHTRTIAWYAWPESPPPHVVLRYLAELAIARAQKGETNHSGSLVAKAFAAMREAGAAPAELRVWILLKLEKARKIAHQAAKDPDPYAVGQLCSMVRIYCTAVEALLQDTDRAGAMKVYKEARRLMRGYAGSGAGNVVGVCILLSDLGKVLGVTDTRSLFVSKHPGAAFSWKLPSVYPSADKTPILRPKHITGASVSLPLLWHKDRLLAYVVRYVPNVSRARVALVIIPISEHGSAGEPREITVPGVGAKDLGLVFTRPGLVARCGNTVLVGSPKGLLVGSLTDPVWRRISIEQGLPHVNVFSVFAENDRTAICFVGAPGGGYQAMCRYDTSAKTVTLIRKHTRGTRHPDIRDWRTLQAWQVNGRWFGWTRYGWTRYVRTRGVWENPFSAKPRRVKWIDPKPWTAHVPPPARTGKTPGDRHFVLLEDLYELDGNGRPVRVMVRFPAAAFDVHTRYLFKQSPQYPGDVPYYGRNFWLIAKARWKDFFILLDKNRRLLVYQATADRWYGPMILRVGGARANMVVTPGGSIFITSGGAKVGFLKIEHILDTAGKAGLVMTTRQMHQQLRRRATKAGPVPLASLELLLHRFKAAETAIDKALRADPNDKDALVLRAVLNSPTMRNKPEEVVAAYQRLAALPDASVRYKALYGMGDAYLTRKKYPEARYVFEAIVDEFGPASVLTGRLRHIQGEMASQKDQRPAVAIKIPKPTWDLPGASGETRKVPEAEPKQARRRLYVLEDLYLGRKLSDDSSRNRAAFDRALGLLSANPRALSDGRRRRLGVLHGVLDLDAPAEVLSMALDVAGPSQEPDALPAEQGIARLLSRARSDARQGAWRRAMATLDGVLSRAPRNTQAQVLRKRLDKYPEVWRIVSSDIEGIRDAFRAGGGSLAYLERVFSKNLPVWRKAADLKWPEGSLLMGRCYTEGLGVKRDPKRGLALYRRAAEGGLGLGHLMVAYCYLTGKGVEKDVNQAVLWWRRAAKAGCGHARMLLGIHYRSRDHAKANECFRRAAEEGYAGAIYEIGRSYEHGWGRRQDHAKAVARYRRAAAEDYALAVNDLAVCYAKGKGVARDLSRSVTLYRRSADMGSTVGMFNLAGLYERGQGVRKDMRKAMYWYRRGADKGDACSMNMLGRCMLSRRLLAVNEEGLSWIRKAIRNGCPHAGSSLGRYERQVAEKRAKTKSVHTEKPIRQAAATRPGKKQ